MNDYISLLKEEETVRRLSLIQLMCYFGVWFSFVAIYTLLVELGVSAFVISIVAVLHFLPGFIQAPFIGAIIDKFNPKKLMVILMIIEIISTFFIVFMDNLAFLGILFILVFLRAGAASFYASVEMSLLPKILKTNKLKLANNMHSMIWSVSYAFGMAISGIIVHYLGVKLSILLDALIFFIALIILINTKIDVNFKKVSTKYFHMLKEGIVYIVNDKKIIFLILIHSSVSIATYDALIALLAKNHYVYYLSVPLAIGFINVVRAIALVVSPMFISKFVNKKFLFYILLFQGFSIIIWSLLAKNFYLSLIGSFLAGMATTSLWGYTYSLIQFNVKKEFYGRVVAYTDMIFMLVASLSSLYIGFSRDYGMDLSFILAGLGFFFILTAFYYKNGIKKYNISS